MTVSLYDIRLRQIDALGAKINILSTRDQRLRNQGRSATVFREREVCRFISSGMFRSTACKLE
jgi:hypothetical protein